MEDFNPKGFIKVGEINGVPIHAKMKSGKLQVNIPKMERPELKRKARVNHNLLNLERPSNGPMERPTSIDIVELERDPRMMDGDIIISTGSESVQIGGGRR